ncbi:DNA primase [Candidatus Falkowbacteria bacterium]|jgi:DNA primase|nr:DNA primase [Candidatus Falkowbacteria bacterium]
MSQAEEIKSKLDIVEVIREYVPVKAVGANFQALCPFHNEKTPSFIISPDKQIWHCFGCGRGGDVFAFVMEKEGLGFMETLRLLAPKAGVVLRYENPEKYSKRNRIIDILELAGKYYAHVLTTSFGQKAREYLTSRGLQENTIKDWGLGYSPDSWDSLYKFLQARPLVGKKYTNEEILEAGLIIKKEGGHGYYDRFRDRIMFPIWNVNNNIIAFTARINPAKEKTEKMGKYINSPQTSVYDKSRVLFALNKAKTAIKSADLAIVVEGQMDVISCHQHGFENVVASSGTALTSEQVALIKRFTKNVALCFDMDSAGQMAADRGIKEVLAQELNLKVIVLPEGKDPDEILRSNPEEFAQAIKEAKPMLEYYFEKISANLELEKLDNKIKVRDQMFVMIDLVKNKTESGYWLKKISEELDFSESDLREEFVRWQSKQKTFGQATAQTVAKEEPLSEYKTREDRLSELLLSLAIKFPDHLSYIISNFEPEYLSSSDSLRFYNNLIIYYNKTNSLDYTTFRIYLEEQGAEDERLLDKLILLGEKDFYNFEVNEAKAEIIKIIVELKKFALQAKIKKLEKNIAQAEKEERQEDLDKLMVELKSLTDEIKNINLD